MFYYLFDRLAQNAVTLALNRMEVKFSVLELFILLQILQRLEFC